MICPFGLVCVMLVSVLAVSSLAHAQSSVPQLSDNAALSALSSTADAVIARDAYLNSAGVLIPAPPLIYNSSSSTCSLTSFTGTGSISGTTLTISAAVAGMLRVGLPISGSGVASGTVITQVISSTAYTVNTSQTIASTTITAAGDGGLQVPSADGKCWLAKLTSALVDASEWGWIADHSSDNTAAWNAIMAAAAQQGSSSPLHVVLPPGYALFGSKPNPITVPITITCSSPGACGIVRNYSPSTNSEPFIDDQYGYLRLENLDIAAGDTTAHGYAISLHPNSASNIYGNWDWFRNVRILYDINGTNGTKGYWDVCWNLDGSHATESSGATAYGLRDVTIENDVEGNCGPPDGSSGTFPTPYGFDIYGQALRHFVWHGSTAASSGSNNSPHNVVLTSAADLGDGQGAENLYLAPRANGVLSLDDATGVTILGQWFNTGNNIASTVSRCTFRASNPAAVTGWSFNTPCDGAAGTWTPTLYGTSTSGSPTYAGNYGSWSINANEVSLLGQIITTALGSPAGQMNIGGLPFQSGSTSYYGTCVFGSYGGVALDSGYTMLGGDIFQSSSAISLQESGASPSPLTLAVSKFSPSTSLYFSCRYRL